MELLLFIDTQLNPGDATLGVSAGASSSLSSHRLILHAVLLLLFFLDEKLDFKPVCGNREMKLSFVFVVIDTDAHTPSEKLA